DMLGTSIHQLSMEASARWMLNDASGKPIRAWDGRGHNFAATYDQLRRLATHNVRGTTADSDPKTFNRDIIAEKVEYGETADLVNVEDLNLRGRVYRHSDSAGAITYARLDDIGNPVAAYDFKGNLLHSSRRLAADYTTIPDWSTQPQLEDEHFE